MPAISMSAAGAITRQSSTMFNRSKMTRFSHYLRSFAAVHPQKTWGELLYPAGCQQDSSAPSHTNRAESGDSSIAMGRIMVSTKAVDQPTKEDTYGEESKKGEKENKGQSKKVAIGSGGDSARANFPAHLSGY